MNDAYGMSLNVNTTSNIGLSPDSISAFQGLRALRALRPIRAMKFFSGIRVMLNEDSQTMMAAIDFFFRQLWSVYESVSVSWSMYLSSWHFFSQCLQFLDYIFSRQACLADV